MKNIIKKLIIMIKRWGKSKINHKEISKLPIKNIDLKTNPKYDINRPWGKRQINMIDKIIVHQAMADVNTEAIHRYHTGPDSHLKVGGAPRIAYHYSIEKDGTIYKVNELDDITWHCRGQNMRSVGILILGNFDGPSYRGTSIPTLQQINSLKLLLDKLREDLGLSKNNIHGHCDFGKDNCPGNIIVGELEKYGRII